MSYEPHFHPDVLDEWRKLDKSVREQFKKKLAEWLENPRVPGSQLSGAKDRFKINLRNAGFRLAHEVRDQQLVVLVVVGKRERNAVYKSASRR